MFDVEVFGDKELTGYEDCRQQGGIWTGPVQFEANPLATVELCSFGKSLSHFNPPSHTDPQDSKTSGFFFIFHANYRRTRWRIITSPHDGTIQEPI